MINGLEEENNNIDLETGGVRNENEIELKNKQDKNKQDKKKSSSRRLISGLLRKQSSGPVKCVICLENDAVNTLEACNHKIICDNPECLQGVADHGKCPICRTENKSILDQNGTLFKGAKKVNGVLGFVPEGMLPASATGNSEENICGVLCMFCCLAVFFSITFVLILPALSASTSAAYINSNSPLNMDIGNIVVELLRLQGATCGVVLAVFLFLLVMCIPIIVVENCCTMLLMVIGILGFFGCLFTLPSYVVSHMADRPFNDMLVGVFIGFGFDMAASCFTFKKSEADEENDTDSRTKSQKFWNFIVESGFKILSAYVVYTYMINKGKYVDPMNLGPGVSCLFGLFRLGFYVPIFPFLFPHVFF